MLLFAPFSDDTLRILKKVAVTPTAFRPIRMGQYVVPGSRIRQCKERENVTSPPLCRHEIRSGSRCRRQRQLLLKPCRDRFFALSVPGSCQDDGQPLIGRAIGRVDAVRPAYAANDFHGLGVKVNGNSHLCRSAGCFRKTEAGRQSDERRPRDKLPSGRNGIPATTTSLQHNHLGARPARTRPIVYLVKYILMNSSRKKFLPLDLRQAAD